MEQLEFLKDRFGDNFLNDWCITLSAVACNSNCKNEILEKEFAIQSMGFLIENIKEYEAKGKQLPSLNSLVTESVGQLLIYKHNVCGGKLPD